MLRNRRIQLGCLLSASALTLFSVRPTLVVADAENVAPPLSIAVPIGGESRTTVQFTVPAIVRTELAALVDTTGSGSADIAPVGATVVGAVDALTQTNPSLRVGVATSGELPVFPFGVSTDVPYQLKAPMSAVRTEWVTALEAIQAVEGGGDVKEGQLVALAELLQSTSADPTRRAVAFDPIARRVVVVSTDSAPHLDTDTWCNGTTCLPYPGPSIVNTQAMLDQAGVTVIVLGRGDVGALRTIAYASGGTVVDVSSPDRIAGLTNAIQTAPITVRPLLTGCEGLAVTSDQVTVRARPGETVSVPVGIAAAAGVTAGPRTCALEFAGVHQTVAINVAMPCDSDGSTPSTTTPSSTTPSSTTIAGSASTTTPDGTTTTVISSTTTTEPATTTTVLATTTSAAPATTTSAAPASTTSAAPATTTSAAPLTTTSAAPATTTSAVPSPTTTAAPDTTTSSAQPATTVLEPQAATAPAPTVPSDPTTTTAPSAGGGSSGPPVVPSVPTTEGSVGPSVPVVTSTVAPGVVGPVPVPPGQCVPVTTVPASTTTVAPPPASTALASTTTLAPTVPTTAPPP